MARRLTGEAPIPSQVHVALSAFGIPSNVPVIDLLGGTINRTYLVSAPQGRLVLKEFQSPITRERLSLICAAQTEAATNGQPVPVPTTSEPGDPFVLVDGIYFTLTAFVDGHTYQDGVMPLAAAARMGAALAGLHKALAALPAATGPSVSLDPAAFKTTVGQLLPLVQTKAHRELLERKLAELGRLPPLDRDLPCRWVHGDYGWRNVIFDDSDQVAGVIDFDNLRFMPLAYDVMRCFSFGFTKGSAEADQFFVAYARTADLTSTDVKAWVEHWWRVLTFRLWPLDVRYTDPAQYQPAWDPFIESLRPPTPEYWHGLIDRLSALTEGAARGGA